MLNGNHAKYAAENDLKPVVSLWEEPWVSEPFDTGAHGICNSSCMAELLTMRFREADPERFSRLRLSPQTLINCNEHNEFYIHNSLYVHDVGIHSMEDYGCIRFRADPILPPNSTSYKARNISYPCSSYDIMDELNKGKPVFANLFINDDFLNWEPHMPPYKSPPRNPVLYNHTVIAFGYNVLSPNPSEQFFTIRNPALWGGKGNLGRVRCSELSCGVSFDAALGGQDESDDCENVPSMEMEIVQVYDEISDCEYTSSNYETDEDEDEEVSSEQGQRGRGRRGRGQKLCRV